MKNSINTAAIVGAGVVGIAYLLDHATCLGLPGWVLPLLSTAQIALSWMAHSPLAPKADATKTESTEIGHIGQDTGGKLVAK